jgi:sirohydrochlorin ferrochelatase
MLGMILVDHGSRVTAANQDFERLVRDFATRERLPIVEPAHMELASPTIAEAFERAVAAGADEILVHPYFLAMGRHASEDVPAQCATAAARWPHVRWSLTPPTGSSPVIFDAIAERVAEAHRKATPGSDR